MLWTVDGLDWIGWVGRRIGGLQDTFCNVCRQHGLVQLSEYSTADYRRLSYILQASTYFVDYRLVWYKACEWSAWSGMSMYVQHQHELGFRGCPVASYTLTLNPIPDLPPLR